MKKISLLLITIFCTPTWAGISITLNVPETLTPTTDSIVRNPVTLEATAFDENQLANDHTLEIDEYQWLVGQWDYVLEPNDNTDILDLPFNFSLNGTSYGKMGISKLGYVVLLPADHISNYFNNFQEIDKNWENPTSSTFQLATHPTIFPLAKNTSDQQIDWNIRQNSLDTVSNNQVDIVLVKNESDRVYIYSRQKIQHRDTENLLTSYPLEQVVVLHSSGDIDLHFDTDFPFETLKISTDTFEGSHSIDGIRYYSGIMIPRRTVNQETLAPVPMTNYITTNGAKSFSFSAASLNALVSEDFPNDGTNLDAATPLLIENIELSDLDLPYTNVFTSGSETLTLPVTLTTNETYNWSVRQLAVYTENSYVSNWTSDWSELNQFSIEKEDDGEDQGEDEDDLFGSINPALFFLLIPLLLFRKKK